MNEEVCTEMPKYSCHKQVHALKIKDVVPNSIFGDESDGRMILVPEEKEFAPFVVSREYVKKHNPVAGGYYVVYEDGYKSFSPAQAFESGYTRINGG